MDTRSKDRYNKITSMAISEKSYNELKEYWDFQRIKEYNWEKICEIVDEIEDKFAFTHGKSGLELKENLWNKIHQDEYEMPPKGWVPKDTKWRLWYEGEPKPWLIKREIKKYQA